MTKLYVPKQLRIQDVEPFVREVLETKLKGAVTIDFSKVKFSRPAGAIYLASCLREIRSMPGDVERCEIRRPRGLITDVESYLDHIGFFRFVFNEGNPDGGASATNRYIPITEISFPEKLTPANSTRLHRKIETESRNIARIISKNDENSDGFNRLLSYSFRETIRNAWEHAETSSCVVFGQSWDTGLAEIAIADGGIGIKSSLGPKFNGMNTMDLIKLALRPGISSKLEKIDYEDEWANTGFGLFMLSEMARSYGYFVMMSDQLYIQFRGKGEVQGELFHPSGTFVAMRLRKLSSSEYNALIDRMRSLGEDEIAENGNTIIVPKSLSID